MSTAVEVDPFARSYLDFLRGKFKFDYTYGFDIDPDEISPVLKAHQRDCVQWALRGGRRAIFASFGLGKTLMQLESMRLIGEHDPCRRLIICPLGVRQEFRLDAERHLGMEVRFVRTDADVSDDCGLYLTNYESIRDGKLDPDLFDAVSLDEASVLRSFGSKTYQTFLSLFAKCKYRFVATATPSPNRYKELIHYAGFLGIMDTGQALTRWFQRDSQHANHLTLYPHKADEFFLWLHSWAIFLEYPSQLGYSDEGYVLPPLDVRWHEIATGPGDAGEDRDGQRRLIRDATLGVTAAAREKRDTLSVRVAAAKALVDESPEDHFVLWHDLEDERRAIKMAIPEAVEIYGTLDLDEREDRIIRFSDGEYRLLATKPELSGSGCNFQRHCHRMIFVGVGFMFNDFIQSVHRCQRFLQEHPVRVDIIYADSEREIVKILRRKWAEHEILRERMSAIIHEHGLDHLSVTELLGRTLGKNRVEVTSDEWTTANNDCVLELSGQMWADGEIVAMPDDAMVADESVGLIVTSIPFGNHYEYCADYQDFGHTDDNGHFWEQMDFLSPQLWRVLMPGRIFCCHVKDRILFGNTTGAGYSTVSPFHAEAIVHYMGHGFEYMGMITVVTDVVRENKQSYRLGWSENAKDGAKMGVGSPEYVLIFRKPQTDRSRGYSDIPVTHDKVEYTRARWQVDAHAFWRSSGDRLLGPEDMEGLTTAERMRLFSDWTLNCIYDYEAHIRIGEYLDGRGVLPATFMLLAPGSHHPDVWTDINRMITLNTEQARRNEALHVCPLQIEIVDRLIGRYSNPGELILDPFGGLGTVAVRSLRLGRRGRSVELNTDYFTDSVRYLQAEERRVLTPSLFDLEALLEERPVQEVAVGEAL
jgi:DNA methylase/SNF2 domain-containing protein